MNSWKQLLRPIGRGLLAALLFLVAMYFFGQWRDALLQARTTQAPPPFRGMALGTFHQDNNHDYEGDLREIKALGANAILVMVPWYQKDIRSNRMEPRYDGKNGNRTLEDTTLAKIISQAHGLDMKVLLMPYLRFDQRATKEWRGVLKPEDFKLWANHYTEFILHYARLAEKQGVEILSVGSELGSLEDKTEFWREVIARTRSQYPGKLVYSANWDHYEHPTFWGDLDYIGITSYHRLTEVLPPSSKDLRKNLTKIKQQTLDFVKKFPGKKLLITEVGYPSLQGASKDPWNYFIDSPVDTAEQALCYSAFIATWNDTPLLEGVFWWVWYGQGGADDKSYTPRGKPAEQELARWYGGNSEKI